MKKFTTRSWLLISLGIAFVERLVLFLTYPLVHYTDSSTYLGLAEMLEAGWGEYSYIRTPGYPLFLYWLGRDETAIYLVQLALGLLTSLLLFYLGWRISGKGWFGALAALAHSLNLQQLFFEADILSESAATFLLVLTLAGVAWLLYSGSKKPGWLALLVGLGVGLVGGGLTLTRPQFIFLPFWAAFFILIGWPAARRWKRWVVTVTIGLGAVVLIGWWVLKVHDRFGIWGLTNMTGYHLVQHTGAFFEYVPDEYAAIRETYLEYRALRVAETGQPNNAIWDAIPALMEVSGQGFVPLSQLLAVISTRLILDHPGLYLQSVLQGWGWFWKAPAYWSPESVAVLGLRSVLGGVVLATRGGLFLANLVFILISAVLLWKKARRFLKLDAFLLFVLGTVWFTSIVSSMLDHGDNPRFSVSIQSLVVVLVIWWIVQFIPSLRKKNEDVRA
ncbi:MAG: glycosyltransferase family 39 protein [Anaerolineales bacterium]|nr:glycosyltransferase family 39 protein [Anaerolineales bacterium]